MRTLRNSILICLLGAFISQTTKATETLTLWSDSFDFSECAFTTSGRNNYFILEPGYRLVLKGLDNGDSVTLEITVLNDTIKIGDIMTRVVEERESAGSDLIEVSRNYFAFCKEYSSIFYFGEEVDIYEKGKIVSHDGAWQAFENNNRAGLMMPGQALIGSSYYQEIAPGIAMDRARILSVDSELDTPKSRFNKCLLTEESSPLEPDATELKYYAPGVGLIKDGNLLLVDSGFISVKK